MAFCNYLIDSSLYKWLVDAIFLFSLLSPLNFATSNLRRTESLTVEASRQKLFLFE